MLLQKTSTQLLSTKEKVNKSRAKTTEQAQVGSNEAMSKIQTNFGEHPLGYTKYSEMYFYKAYTSKTAVALRLYCISMTLHQTYTKNKSIILIQHLQYHFMGM